MQITNSSLQNFLTSFYFICLGSKNSFQHFSNTFKLLITEMKSDPLHFCWDFPTGFLLAADWTFRGSNPTAGRSFSLLHFIHSSLGVHLATCTMSADGISQV
jgi:hypothetical protein